VSLLAFMGYCEKCHHLHAVVDYIWLLAYFIDHNIKCHGGSGSYFITRISAKEFQTWLKNKDNPAFWKAWRDSKKQVHLKARAVLVV